MRGIGRARALAQIGCALLAAAALAACGDEGTSGGPKNVIVVVSDDQPLRTVRYMPYLSSDPTWTRFSRAAVANPLCCPSRASILRGQYGHRTGVENNADGRFLKVHSTVATWLREAGYRTGLIGKYMNGYPWDYGDRWIPPGWDEWAALAAGRSYYDYTLNVNGKLVEKGSDPRHHIGREIERRTLRFLRQANADDVPYMLMVSHYAPHAPATPDPRDAGALEDAEIELPPNTNEADVSDKPRWVQELDTTAEGFLARRVRGRAEAALSVDRLLERITDELERSGQLDETVVIYLTDHGDSLGEHRHIGKACGYEECVRVPLYVRWPGGGPEEIGALAGNIDIAPTIVEVTEAESKVPPGYEWDGESLAPLLQGEGSQGSRSLLLHSNPDKSRLLGFWGLRTERYKYLELSSGERELYDLASDPFELDNLIGLPASRRLARRLAGRLDRMRPTRAELIRAEARRELIANRDEVKELPARSRAGQG